MDEKKATIPVSKENRDKKKTTISVLRENRSAILVSLSLIIGLIFSVIYYNYEMTQVKKIDYEANRLNIEYIAEDILNTRKIDTTKLDKNYEYDLDVQYDSQLEDDIVKIKISKLLYKSFMDDISLVAVINLTKDGTLKTINYTPNTNSELISSIHFKVILSSISILVTGFFVGFFLIELIIFIFQFIKYKNLT